MGTLSYVVFTQQLQHTDTTSESTTANCVHCIGNAMVSHCDTDAGKQDITTLL